MSVNLRDCELEPYDEGPAGRTFRLRALGEASGAKATGCTVYELDPEHASWPYHFELTEEEWLFVIGGEITVRTPDEERVLRPGDVVCFRAGASGAHAVANRGAETARFAMISTGELRGGGTVYPDEGKFKLFADGFVHRGLLGEPVDYWEGV